MVRIIDRTLSCIDKYMPEKEKVNRLAGLLSDAGLNYIECSEYIYSMLGAFANKEKLFLRLDNIENLPKYPEINRFVCKNVKSENTKVVTEIQANDLREINHIMQYGNFQNVRICGLDDIMIHSFENSFKQIITKLQGHIQLCPENSYDFATAIVVEWIIFGQTDVVTAFSGIGNFAPTEEVIIALRSEKRYKPNQSYAMFPEIKRILEEITGKTIPSKKPVIGSEIFHVEAGIHIDGINKAPKNYEPFEPELVGNERKFVLGKHSGTNFIKIKLKELGIESDKLCVNEVLNQVRAKSINKTDSLTDSELIEIVELLLSAEVS